MEDQCIDLCTFELYNLIFIAKYKMKECGNYVIIQKIPDDFRVGRGFNVRLRKNRFPGAIL